MTEPKIILTLSRISDDESIIISELEGGIAHDEAQEVIISMAVRTITQAEPLRGLHLAQRFSSEMEKARKEKRKK